MNLSIILYKYKQRHTDTDVMYFTKYRYPPPHSFLLIIIVFERLWPPAEYLASIVLIVCRVIFDDRRVRIRVRRVDGGTEYTILFIDY